MGDRVEVVDYDPAWPMEFAVLGRALRAALGGVAVRIDHIGSTSVPGLAAKPVIDVQISVRSLEPLEVFKTPLERIGLTHRANNTELTKRYFREAPGSRRTHVHVRELGSFSQQLPLLFRDYLRAHPTAAAEFANTKTAVRSRVPRRTAPVRRGQGAVRLGHRARCRQLGPKHRLEAGAKRRMSGGWGLADRCLGAHAAGPRFGQAKAP